ncbi:hypothetical protein [Tautonia marina]|uniref:hypothetical protein n=1 Tax=Tautonia marina TaxID=2653855 RepID=UPI0012609155|nr:hypothetical protein [Tautonia marina]
MSTKTINSCGNSALTKDPEGLYNLLIKTDACLYSREDFGYIDVYEGRVIFSPYEGSPERAGSFMATVLRGTEAISSGYPISELWDYTQSLHDCYSVLFDPRSDEYKKSIRNRFEPLSLDVLVLDRIEVMPRHRGRYLGLAVADRMINVLGRGCGLVVCRPLPLQFSERVMADPVKRMELALDEFDPQDWDGACSRLRHYWSKLGFERIGTQKDYLVLSPALGRPRVEMLCPWLM